MRTRVGVTVDQFEGLSPAFIFKSLKTLGLNFLELNNSIFPEIDVISNHVGRMQTAFHLPFYHTDRWDFSYDNHQDKIDKTIEKINTYKSKLNIQHVICHPPETDVPHLPTPRSTEILFSNLEKLDCPIYIENVQGFTPLDFIEFYKKSKKALGDQIAGICFDAPHFYISGYDPVETFNKLANITGTIHLSDSLDYADLHLPFNSGGTMPINKILKQIQNSNFNGYITLEIQPTAPDKLDAYISTYLYTLAHFDRFKYYRTKFRLTMLQPLIKQSLKKLKN